MQYNKKTAQFCTILSSHQQEKERLLAQPFVAREGLAAARSALSLPLILVITGPRRAGKSTVALHLLENTDFAYVNFDDERLTGAIDTTALLQALHTVYGETSFLLFDEIQNVPHWELFVNRLHRQGYHLIITGSNSQLLSQEMATHLTGRHQAHQILPFSFAEYCRHRGERIPTLPTLDTFLKSGGYPEVLLSALDGRTYLKTLYESILFKDVSKRFRIRYPQQLADLGYFLMSHCAREISATSLAKFLNFRSTHTAEHYLHYLIQAYLCFLVPRFSHSLKSQIKSPKKVYAYDTGMAEAVRFNASQDMGYSLENAVAIELNRRGKTVFTYKTARGREVDFAIKEGLAISSLIQVVYDLSSPKTEERELRALVDAAQELNCNDLLLLTGSASGTTTYKGYSIHLQPVSQWLLQRRDTL